jgi:hypothetical protein
MPNKMTIRIVDVPTDDPNVKQTVSKFVVVRNDQVTFSNKGSADAVVEFKAGSPLCKGNQPFDNPFTLGVNGEEKLKVCVDGGEYKYTATVTGALAEDPILIVERAVAEQPSPPPAQPERKPIVFPEDVVPLLAGLAIGAIIGFLAGRRSRMRNP